VLAQHQAGVTDAALDELEETLGIELPDDVRQFYKLVNGDDPNEASSGIFPSVDDYDPMAYGPLAISQLQREWEIQNELLEGGDFEGCEPDEVDSGILNECWNAGWIPFAGNGGGDLYCIDMVPGEGGTVGQMISHNHETCDHKLLANSFGDYLAKLAERLESGELSFRDEWGVCTPD
jgi:cell wall assembly regulator SMI1